MRFRGRSYLALVLAPEQPLADWLAALDDWTARSPGFFAGRPVVLDISNIGDNSRDEIAGIIADLSSRDIRIMAVEGADQANLGLGLPPAVAGGRQSGIVEAIEPQAAALLQPQPGALIIEEPIRSGMSVVYPKGDVIITGFVSSGAEIIAGGSIHVYGALRGRAIAGSTGNARARIFCRKFEAELIAIDGLYRSADDVEPRFAGKATQAWLDGDAIVMATLD